MIVQSGDKMSIGRMIDLVIWSTILDLGSQARVFAAWRSIGISWNGWIGASGMISGWFIGFMLVAEASRNSPTWIRAGM